MIIIDSQSADVMMNELFSRISNVDFEITYSCNLRCIHCYNPHHKKLRELNTQEIKQVISKIRETGFEKIHINGGEPLLRKDVYDIIDYSIKIGLNVLLETNALLLDAFISKFKLLPKFSIRASIDGLSSHITSSGEIQRVQILSDVPFSIYLKLNNQELMCRLLVA